MSVKAYHEREKRRDLRIGILASLTANLWRDPKRSKPVKPQDFFASLMPPKRVQTPEEQRNYLLAMVRARQGEVKRIPREEYEAMIRG